MYSLLLAIIHIAFISLGLPDFFLVQFRGVQVDIAVRFASLFFLGITLGRFACGFISDKVGDKRLIRYGTVTVMLGIFMVIFPLYVLILQF